MVESDQFKSKRVNPNRSFESNPVKSDIPAESDTVEYR